MSAIALLLGDRLWLGNPALEGLERTRDRVLMIEASGEATQVWSHKQRIAPFLAALRRRALYANGGRFTSKPYAASGRYVARMRNSCKGCRYRPEARAGEDACPMTVQYWNFVLAHETEFRRNPRMAQVARNAARFDAAERRALRTRAARMLDNIARL